MDNVQKKLIAKKTRNSTNSNEAKNYLKLISIYLLDAHQRWLGLGHCGNHGSGSHYRSRSAIDHGGFIALANSADQHQQQHTPFDLVASSLFTF